MNAQADRTQPRDESRSIRRQPDRWKVVASVRPQGEAGVRWIQLTYAHDELLEGWPYTNQ